MAVVEDKEVVAKEAAATQEVAARGMVEVAMASVSRAKVREAAAMVTVVSAKSKVVAVRAAAEKGVVMEAAAKVKAARAKERAVEATGLAAEEMAMEVTVVEKEAGLTAEADRLVKEAVRAAVKRAAARQRAGWCVRKSTTIHSCSSSSCSRPRSAAAAATRV